MGYEVVVVDNLSNGNDKQINEETHFISKSILNNDLYEELNEFKFDEIYHMAAYLGVEQASRNPLEVLNVETLGTLNILNFAVKQKIKFLGIASTSEVYGELGNRKEMKEEDTLSINTPYYTSKSDW